MTTATRPRMGYRPIPRPSRWVTTWLLTLAFAGLVFVTAFDSTAGALGPAPQPDVVLHMTSDPTAADVTP